MEESNVTVKSVAIKYGLINGLIGIILFTIMDFANMGQSQVGNWAGAVIGVILMVLAHQEFKKQGDGFMSYGQGLGLGTLMSVVGGTLNSIYVFLYVSFINPEFLNAMKEKSIMDMEKRGMTDEQIEQGMKFAENFMTPIAMLIMGIFISLFFGFILALIVSAFTKKNTPELR